MKNASKSAFYHKARKEPQNIWKIWKIPEKKSSIFESEEKTNNQGVSKRPAKTPTTIVIWTQDYVYKRTIIQARRSET